MFETVLDLPLHPLVVHAVVVFLPAAAAAVLAAAVWPRFRRWAGPLPLILAVAGTVLVPVAVRSGQFFRDALDAGQLPEVQKHQSLGENMLWWGIGLVIAAGLVFWWHLQTRPSDHKRQPARPMVIAIVLVAAIASVGTLVHIFRVGDSGSRAAWSYVTEDSAG